MLLGAGGQQALDPVWQCAALANPALQVPPLRARPGDVKQMASVFLQQHANRTGGGQHPGLQAAALR